LQFLLLECYSATSSAVSVDTRELHGDGDDGITAVTAVMGLDFMMDTVVIAGMGTAATVVPQ